MSQQATLGKSQKFPIFNKNKGPQMNFKVTFIGIMMKIIKCGHYKSLNSPTISASSSAIAPYFVSFLNYHCWPPLFFFIDRKRLMLIFPFSRTQFQSLLSTASVWICGIHYKSNVCLENSGQSAHFSFCQKSEKVWL